ncbi:uncharacterized protein G2W53_035835 [Senna tora]|uniref:Uncharacterized protein n=1 Tax=Senna tora TaxID=362788 RepID=A0A834W4H5_9FABA|nr:uncharacterized protein G2W53_035835 [Senna tora]
MLYPYYHYSTIQSIVGSLGRRQSYEPSRMSVMEEEGRKLIRRHRNKMQKQIEKEMRKKSSLIDCNVCGHKDLSKEGLKYHVGYKHVHHGCFRDECREGNSRTDPRNEKEE